MAALGMAYQYDGPIATFPLILLEGIVDILVRQGKGLGPVIAAVDTIGTNGHLAIQWRIDSTFLGKTCSLVVQCLQYCINNILVVRDKRVPWLLPVVPGWVDIKTIKLWISRGSVLKYCLALAA